MTGEGHGHCPARRRRRLGGTTRGWLAAEVQLSCGVDDAAAVEWVRAPSTKRMSGSESPMGCSPSASPPPSQARTDQGLGRGIDRLDGMASIQRVAATGEDIAASLIGIFTVAHPPEHHVRATRLLTILMDGLRPAP